MKKFLLLLVLCLGVSITNARDVGFYLDEGVTLSGDQWHYDNLSIVYAGNGNYLVITPNEYHYSYLADFSYPLVRNLIRDEPASYRPYVRDNYIGWLVYGRSATYFVYQIGNGWYCMRFYSAPVYYDYRYELYGIRYVDMRRWHFAPPPVPRHHRHHHHHGTPPPPPYNEHHHGTPPPDNNRGGYVQGSQRGSGNATRPANPPAGERPNGSARPSNPHSGNRSTSVRSSGSSSRESRHGGYSTGSNRNSGRSSGGSVSRSPSGSRSGNSSRSSGNSTRRR